MLLYLDTNIILARYAPDEPQHDEAKDLLSKIEEGELSAVTSILTLVEVVCAASRAYERFADKVGSLGREEVTGAFLRRVVHIRNLGFVPMGGEVLVNVMKRRVKLPALFVMALEMGSKTGVKTLDTLHLASASIASRIYGHKIDCFVTLDEDILKRREDISGLIESRVLTPAEMV
jgi:predicted nucleic acid-binding protein